jgi:hypothetical protein
MRRCTTPFYKMMYGGREVEQVECLAGRGQLYADPKNGLPPGSPARMAARIIDVPTSSAAAGAG